MVQLSKLAPDLKAFFTDLGPLIDASKQGLPATQQFLDELHPLLAEFDGPLKQLNPILDGAALYKGEIAAFFGNSSAATQASTPATTQGGEPVHYLRTSNPLNPEMLAVYAKRLSSNRGNAYPFPGDTLQLKDGLPAFETRNCKGASSPVPFNLGPPLEGAISDTLRTNILRFALGDGQVASPPCKQQDRFSLGGTLTQFPQLKADVNGVQAGPPQP
jgi:hypothetical protein